MRTPAKHRENEAVKTPVARRAPREHEEDACNKEVGVYRDRAGEHEIEIHERTKERRDADEESEDKSHAYKDLAPRYEIRKENWIRENSILQEHRVPALHIRVTGRWRRRAKFCRLLKSSLHETSERGAG